MIKIEGPARFDALALGELHIDRTENPGVSLRAKFVLLQGGSIMAKIDVPGINLNDEKVQKAMGGLLDALERKASTFLFNVDQRKEQIHGTEPKGIADEIEEADQI